MSGPRYYRTRRQDQRLVGYACRACGWISFPDERTVCKQCGDAPAEFETVQLAEHGTVCSFVTQKYLPEEFEVPQSVAIIEVPTIDDDGHSVRIYGLLTETQRTALEVGTEVEARFREQFADGDRPINSFKFAVPREEQS